MVTFGRTLPPAASPIYLRDILNGIRGIAATKKETARFRQELQTHFGTQHNFLTSSGKAALTLILRALANIFPGRNKIIVPAYNCYSVPSAIKRAGLHMEPCEMNPDTFDFDYSALKNMLGSNEDHISREEKQKEILAILPTNFFGIPSDIQHIRKLISDPDITIIEDSAQSMGEKRAEGYQGTGGDVGFFSLGRGKAFSTIEGGIIITNRKDIADTISSQLEDVPSYTPSGIIKLFLQSIVLWLFMFPRLFWIPKSMPFLKLGETIYDPDFPIKQLNPFQVGLTRGWQKKLAHLRNTRKSNIKNWLSILPAQYYPFLKKYTNNPPACIRLPIRIRNKKLLDSLQQNSDNKGWGVMPTYPNTLDIFLRAETRQGNKNFAYPSAKILCDEIVTLPAHPYITGKDIRNISEMMRQTALLFPDTERQPNPLT